MQFLLQIQSFKPLREKHIVAPIRENNKKIKTFFSWILLPFDTRYHLVFRKEEKTFKSVFCFNLIYLHNLKVWIDLPKYEFRFLCRLFQLTFKFQLRTFFDENFFLIWILFILLLIFFVSWRVLAYILHLNFWEGVWKNACKCKTQSHLEIVLNLSQRRVFHGKFMAKFS